MTELKYTAKTIEDASKSEIIKFAKSAAGLVFDEGANRDYMISEIFEALEWQPKDPTEGATHVEIRVGYSDGEGGKQDVRVNYNGKKAMTLKRETPTVVPIGFYYVLQDVNECAFNLAPMTSDSFTSDKPSQDKIQVMKYPIQVLRYINKGA